MRPFIIALTALTLSTFVFSQNCNTNQNPYCSGNAQLEAICCTYPNVCYWSDRDGTPACCPAGQDCRLSGGPGPTLVSTYYVVQTVTTQQYVTQTVYNTPTPVSAVAIVTTVTNTVYSYNSWSQTMASAYTAIASSAAGVVTSVTQSAAGAAQSTAQILLTNSTSKLEPCQGLILSALITLCGLVAGLLLF